MRLTANTAQNIPIDEESSVSLAAEDRARPALVYKACLIFLLALIIYAAPGGNRSFFTRGEGREAVVVQAMIDQSNYILPFRNAVDIPSKPPMFHWTAVLAAKIFAGPSEFAIRFPSALYAALVLAVLFVFAGRFSNQKTAALLVIILASSFEWSRSASHARVDMCFTAWLSLALLSFFAALNSWMSGSKPRLSWFIIAGLATASAVLTKGPAALLLIGAVVACSLLAICHERIRDSIRSFPLNRFALSLLLAVTLPAIWYYLAYLQHGYDFLQVQLFRENLARLGAVDGFVIGHKKPFYYALLHLFVGFLPWSLLLPLLVSWVWQQRKTLFTEEKTTVLFSLIWFSVIFLAVTFSVSKRVVYMLPAFPPLAYLLALMILDQKMFCRLRTISRYFMALGLSVLSAALVIGLGLIPLIRSASSLGEVLGISIRIRTMLNVDAVIGLFLIDPSLVLLTLLSAALFLTAAMFFWRRDLFEGSCWLFAAMCALSFTVNMLILPSLARANSPSVLIEQAKNILPPDAKLYQYGVPNYSAIYYAERAIPEINSLEELDQYKETNQQLYLLVPESELEVIRESPSSPQLILQSHSFAAYQRQPLFLVSFGKR